MRKHHQVLLNVFLATSIIGFAQLSYAALYVCEKDGKKTYSDKVCGEAAKEITGDDGRPITLGSVPDDETIKKLCRLAEKGKQVTTELIRKSAEHELGQQEYNQGIMENDKQIRSRVEITSDFQCAHGQLANKIMYIVAEGYPFGPYNSNKSGDSPMRYCIDEIKKAIRETDGENSRC